MGQSDLDKLVGSEPEDVVKKFHSGVPHDRATDLAPDELVPEKAMPFKETPKPFVFKTNGNGG